MKETMAELESDLTSPLFEGGGGSAAVAGDDAPPGQAAPKAKAKVDPFSFKRSARGVSFMDRSARWPARVSEVDRADHMSQLIQQRKDSVAHLFASVEGDIGGGAGDLTASASEAERMEELQRDSEFVQRLQKFLKERDATALLRMPEMEIRLEDLSYKVPSLGDGSGKQKIHTLYNSSPLYWIKKSIERLGKPKEETEPTAKTVLSNVELVLKPRKMYLVLGPPLSGKTSLLKAIAGMLPQGEFPSGYPEKKHLSGRVVYNNLVCLGEGADESNRSLFKNLVAFVRQNDCHAPRLTVGETFVFAGSCKDEDVRKNKKGTSLDGMVGLTLQGLGLGQVKDTFVGNEQVRGVSGGQRRRVTLGEMAVFDTPLLCGDEISTGLDTASTVEILRILSFITYTFGRVSVVSLLQPSPEAVSLFDEIILLSDGGHIIYAGPTENAAAHFKEMGYVQPDSMDNADYLLAVASSDRKHLYKETDDPNTPEELAASFSNTKESQTIAENQLKGWERDWTKGHDEGGHSKNVDGFRRQYANSFWVSVGLNLKRAFVLWTRDRIFIRASVIKNIAMGLSVGFVFLNTDVSSSFFGVLFQGNLFIMLGAMTSAPDKLDDRAIFYKHNDSNFYPALSYLIGQSVALIPQMLIDVLLFGTLVYWLVGFVATAQGFLLYLALFFSFNFTMGQCFGLLASIAPNKSIVSAGGAVILLLNTLFCGYIVSPTVIPNYYIWIYWMMPLAWVYRALILNEFTSDDPNYDDGVGDQILQAYGFLYNGEPFTREWIGYCFAFLLAFLTVCFVVSAACLHYLRMEPKPTGTPDTPEKDDKEAEDDKESSQKREASFVPVNVSFKDLSYEVKASKGSDKLRLLDNISGIFSAGRMCALMGESGAGKTTLMDVIALRKGSGDISGEVLLNGFPQEGISFRRCSGYVEQFDVQSAELTVRETILFSAQLRLDKSNPVYDTTNGLDEHIDSIMKTFELTNEAELLVGNEEDGGLTFEQKKRLSIAVEVAASPSIVFLDEPTSGLDARAAILVMNGLKKLCDSGRTVVATIHQPSSSVFDMFDDLLLLKKGGQVVFFGDLGTMSGNLVSYFEDLGATTMNKGENPATWMLNVLGEKIMISGKNGEEPLDFADAWKKSLNCADLEKRVAEAAAAQDPEFEIKYDTEFAAPWLQRDNLMAKRLVTIYWRSPAYNLSRMLLSLGIAFLLGSIFIPIRSNIVFSEAEMTSLLSTIFISFIITGVLAITTVIPVALSIRDMYYRHKAAGMLNARSVGRAFASAETRFIIIAASLFCIMFVPTSGIVNSPNHDLRTRASEAIAFWGFFAFNGAIYSYIGQLFTCLVRGQGTATILASVFIGINNFFSGLIVRPQQMTGLWAITYWINPGHFVYEGLCMSVFSNDSRNVIVSEGSDYYPTLCVDLTPGTECEVEVSEFVNAFFGGLFQHHHILRNAIILACILTFVRASTYVALGFVTYSGK